MKHCVSWILAVVVALSLMTQFSAKAADKVVVVPLISRVSGDEVPTVKSKTGRIWMDRNLGAARVAGSKSDSLAYGWLYQWGRPADGHESRTSPVTALNELSNSAVPGHGKYILVSTYPINDWLSTPDNNLWKGVSAANNPCPQGFRVPTFVEWAQEYGTWSSLSLEGAYESELKIVAGGYRDHSSDTLLNVGSDGYYWATGNNGSYIYYLYVKSGQLALNDDGYRSYGQSVRCIKD